MEIYDNGGKTFDRYTVILGNEVYVMSDNALSPNGVNQYGCQTNELRGNRQALGRLRDFDSLPSIVKQAIQQRQL